MKKTLLLSVSALLIVVGCSKPAEDTSAQGTTPPPASKPGGMKGAMGARGGIEPTDAAANAESRVGSAQSGGK